MASHKSLKLAVPNPVRYLQGPARSGQRSMPCSAMELSSAVHGASLPSRAQSTAPERNAQGSRRAPQQRQKALQQVKHQRGRVLPTSASLGRLTVPSSLRAPPEPSSELTVTGPCLDLPSCLRQLVDLRNVSECQSPAGFPTCNSSASGGQASAPLAAPFPAQSVGANEVDAQCQAVTAVEGGAQQEACSASEQHAAQQGQIGQLPFASHVQLFGQVLCEQLRDEESPTLVGCTASRTCTCHEGFGAANQLPCLTISCASMTSCLLLDSPLPSA